MPRASNSWGWLLGSSYLRVVAVAADTSNARHSPNVQFGGLAAKFLHGHICLSSRTNEWTSIDGNSNMTKDESQLPVATDDNVREPQNRLVEIVIQ
jgi:hypothetical protein